MYITTEAYWKALQVMYHTQVQIQFPGNQFDRLFGCITLAQNCFHEIQFPDGRWDIFLTGEFRVIPPEAIHCDGRHRVDIDCFHFLPESVLNF